MGFCVLPSTEFADPLVGDKRFDLLLKYQKHTLPCFLKSEIPSPGALKAGQK